MTGNTAEVLIPDIFELREAVMPWRSLSDDYRDSYCELWWCDTVRQLADNLTKLMTPSGQEFFNILKTGVIRLGGQGVKTFERPRATQRAHVFWARYFDNVVKWDRESEQDRAAQLEQLALDNIIAD